MTTKTFGMVVRATVAAAALMGAQLASAQVGVGSIVHLGNGVGSLAGVFNGSVVAGPGAGGTFLSFCLEKNEFFNSYTQNLYVQGVTNHTVNAPGAYATTSDPLSSATAWLFTQFSSSGLAGYTGTESSANSLQRAIWYLEDEITAVDLNLDAQATTWVAAANAATGPAGSWTGLGNVRVLNLFRDANFTQHSQDQIYLVSSVPEPETYGMMLAGLGLMGAIVRRRNKAGRK